MFQRAIAIALFIASCNGMTMNSRTTNKPSDGGEGMPDYLVEKTIPAGESGEVSIGTGNVVIRPFTADFDIIVRLQKMVGPSDQITSVVLGSALSDVIKVEILDLERNPVSIIRLQQPFSLQQILPTKLAAEQVDFNLIDLSAGDSQAQVVAKEQQTISGSLQESEVTRPLTFAADLNITAAYFYLTLGTEASEEDGPNDVTLGQSSSTTSTTLPVNSSGPTIATVTARSFSIGGNSTCAVLDDKSLKCWGSNGWGMLGQGISGSENLGDGSLELGNNLPAVRLGTGHSVKQVAVGQSHTCAILDDGKVKCWGYNSGGQLGQGHSGSNVGEATGQMGDGLAITDIGTNRSAVEVVVGSAQTCVILDNGGVKCWGLNDEGLLGLGVNMFSVNFVGKAPADMGDSLAEINLGTGRSAKHLSMGSKHVCAILDNDSLKCWGRKEILVPFSGGTGCHLDPSSCFGDDANEMGDALPTLDLGTGRTVKQVSVGSSFICVILDNSALKCWGANSLGQLGLGHTNTMGDDSNEMGDALPAINLGSGRSAVQVATGKSHACALLDNGSVKCWGYNFRGQLGYGHTNNIGDGAGEMGDALPAVSLGIGRTALQIATGDEHSCAILDNGTVKCWGYNNYGQLGQGHVHNIGDGPNENGESDMGDHLQPIELGTGRSVIQLGLSGYPLLGPVRP